jgi:primase-polymerase (primpol)-like protein
VSEALPTREDLPPALLEHDQWLCWREEDRDGKPTKIPIDPTTGEFASTTDPETWTGFEAARERATSEDGLGFVFTDDDPFVGVDLDDCRVPETETTLEWADEVIETLDSFTEISPSGTGFHVLVKGDLPDGRNRKDDLELYETARFFTVTADHVAETPTTIQPRTQALRTVYEEYVAPDHESDSGDDVPESTPNRSLEDDELLQKAKNAANGEKFQSLWKGSTSGYESQSEADMALCSLLAFWTGGDARQMDQLFRDSGLMREKWDEQHFADGSTYGEKTIERAIEGTSEFYEPAGTADEPPEVETGVDTTELRERETERLERIEELEARLTELMQTNEELKAELEAERERRQALEEELESLQEENESSLFGWR